jgi:hypothetical protein
MKTFNIGDKVKLTGCPFDEQIVEELLMYTFLKDKIQVVTEVMVPEEENTSNQWIKTNHIADWIDYAWFEKVEN